MRESTESYQPPADTRSFGQKCLGLYHPLKMVPILTWIRSYQLSFIIPDIVAGVTVCFMLIPQALSYSEAAGLDAKFGLYSAFFGPLIYTIFGGSKYANFGPTLVSCNLMRSFISIPG